MKKNQNFKKLLNKQVLYLSFLFLPIISFAQIGELIWEDNFNTLDENVWTIDIGDGCDQGLCGFGNAELQSYEADNVSIQPIPGEPGNSALAFEARRENTPTRAFTSGKVESEDKLSVQYGLIEVRMQVPDLNTGLWPAAWLLGTSNLVWPAKGEIDMMEMGHRAEERARQGHPGVNMNNYVGANAIFADENGGVASIAFDTGFNQPYVAENSMANRFVTYRLYWEPSQIRYTVIDNGVESDLYVAPLPLDPNGITKVFNRPFYLIMNLAVGGTFTDAAVNNDITASLPARSLIDYVRVYKWNGFGSVETNYRDLEAENGVFGVFTETTPTQNELQFGTDAEIFIWGGTMQEANEPAFEGNEVISWETVNPNDWFGGGVLNIFGKNMSEFVEDGTLRFNIKVPADLNFRIGITDNFTNESWVEFPAGENKFGLVRNGDWSQVEIPLQEFAGLIAFQDIAYMFAISSIDGSFPTEIEQIAIDNIVWDSGNDVSTISVTGVSASPSSSTITVGNTQALDATVTPENATNQNVNWSSNNTAVATVNSSGVVTAISSGNATITATTVDGSFTDTISITVESEASSFPDPNKTYYIDNLRWNLRLGADGQEDPFTTSTTTTGSNVEWRITPSPTEGHYYIDCVGGGNTPRLRSDQTINADMQATSSGGTWTRWNFTEASNNGYFYLSTLNQSDFMRLQVTNTGSVRTVAPNFTGNWTHFKFTEVPDAINEDFNERIEAEDYTNMNGVQTENTSDTGGGLNVGFIDTGDWMEYVVDIPADGAYNVDFRVASLPGNAAVQFRVNNIVLTTANINTTGGWQNWTTLSRTVNLSAGTQTIRLYAPASGWNINWFEISSTNSKNAITSKEATKESSSTGNSIASQLSLFPNPVKGQLQISMPDYKNYNNLSIIDITGKILMEVSQIDNNIVRLDTERLSQGVYFLMATLTDGSNKVYKFIK